MLKPKIVMFGIETDSWKLLEEVAAIKDEEIKKKNGELKKNVTRPSKMGI